MNLQELDKLIQKYYQGISNEDEEERLLKILSSEELPPEYSDDLAMLKLMFEGDEDIPEPDSGFEARIMEAIDKADTGAGIISLKRKIYMAVSVAATLLIVISSYFIVSNNTQPADTFDDPVLAYNATIQVLSRVGETLNTGSDVISELSVISVAEDNLTRISQPARIISNKMESLKYIEKSMDILDMGSVNNDN